MEKRATKRKKNQKTGPHQLRKECSQLGKSGRPEGGPGRSLLGFLAIETLEMKRGNLGH